jgi:hypothetical protein
LRARQFSLQKKFLKNPKLCHSLQTTQRFFLRGLNPMQYLRT